MIYVIRTKYSDCTLLKIGYTGDDNFNARVIQYKLHNPRCEFLYTIQEGTEEDEKNLHWLFRKFLYKDYGKEWFYEDQTIYEFFNLNRTKKDLDNNLPKHYRPSISSKEKHRLIKIAIKLINRWLCISSDNVQKLNENYNNYQIFISDCKNQVGKSIKTEDDIITYLSIKYSISEEVQKELLNPSDNIIVKEFIEKFNSLKYFKERMKLFCEMVVNDEARGIILDQIPLYIAKEYSDLQFDVSKISDEVYKTFKSGQRYPRNTIKDMLCTIYSSLGYNKTPKANDLEQYFEIKECKVLNSETNKREHGFEIIKIKEGDS